MSDRFSTLVYLKSAFQTNQASICSASSQQPRGHTAPSSDSATDRTLVAEDDASNSSGATGPPDGGLKAWSQVFASFLLFFNTWGTINSFGVYQTYYQTTLLRDDSPSTIAWLGSIQAALLSCAGVVTGSLYDAGYMRQLLAAGTVLVPLGMLAASAASRWWHLLLSQALCVGLGAGCLHIPSVATLPQWFSPRRRALALGVAAAGSSLGGVVYPVAFRRLQLALGFAWAVRAIALVQLVTIGTALCIMRERRVLDQSVDASVISNTNIGNGSEVGDSQQQHHRQQQARPRSTKRRIRFEPRAFLEAPYAVYCGAAFTSSLGFFGPQVYAATYALETPAIGMSAELAFYLLPMLNAASTPGRILPGLLAGRVGPLNVLMPSVAAAGVLGLCWIAIRHGSAGLLAFVCLYGFFSGAYVALPSAVLANMTPERPVGGEEGEEEEDDNDGGERAANADVAGAHRRSRRTPGGTGRLATRLGMVGLINGAAGLVGTPIMGALLAAGERHLDPASKYLGVQLFSGCFMFLTAVLHFALRCLLVGPKLRVRV